MFTRSDTELRSDLESLRTRCRKAATMAQGPFTGKDPFDRLRHLYAHVMQLDVIFQPIKGWFPLRGEDGNFHSLTCPRQEKGYCRCKNRRALAFAWASNPVWGKAPPRALDKARALCTLLHSVVTHGHYIDLSHDLARISKMIWKISYKDFKRLLRRITARIAGFVRCAQFLKSPEPIERFGALTMNPAGNSRVCWVPPSRKTRKSSIYVPRYVPPWRRRQNAWEGNFPKPDTGDPTRG